MLPLRSAHGWILLSAFLCAGLSRLAGADTDRAGFAPTGTESTDGTWVHFPPVVRPGAIGAGASFCDASRGRVLLFGGRWGITTQNDVWSASLTGPVRWTKLLPLGTPPAARFGHTMVYDSQRDRLLVFGGTSDGTTGLNDVWELTLTDPPTWNQISVPSPPAARFFHVAIYDPVGDRMIVFGGASGGVSLNDTWQLTLSGTPAWSPLTGPAAGQYPRYLASAIYDPVGSRMVLFGGIEQPPASPAVSGRDVWTLNLSGTPAWTALSVGGALPNGRNGAGAFYDSARNRMVLIGGRGYGEAGDAPVLALNLGTTPTWSAISPLGPETGARSQICLIYDAAQDRAIVYGGLGAASESADGWVLSLGGTPRWSEFEPSPTARFSHSAVYDAVRKQMVVFGGKEFGFSRIREMNDTWSAPLDGSNNWTPIVDPNAPAPPPRSDQVLVADSARDRLILFGGVGTVYFNDTWTFDLGSHTWSQVSTPTVPSGRLAMAGVFDDARSRLLIVGGSNGAVALNETWEMALLPSPHWTKLTVAGSQPTGRYGHTLVYDSARDRVLLFGGTSGTTSNNEVWSMNLSGPPTWTQLQPTGSAPSPRFSHSAMYDTGRDRMVIFGGFGGAFLNDVFALDLTTPTPNWIQLHPSGSAPLERDGTAAVYDPIGDRFVVEGGNGSRVPPAGDTWALTWADIPTATTLAFADELTAPGTARLTWFTPEGSGQEATAYRSADGTNWNAVALLTSDAAGQFVLEDRVPPGGRFGYRLGVATPAGEQFTEPHWVEIPIGIAFGITSVGPNPSRGGIAVGFAMATPGDVSLDLFSVAGRCVWHRDVSALGVGTHTLRLAMDGQLPSGVYIVRLVQGSRSAERKLAVVR